ncbi:MAG TPA: hypothetical protein VGF23_07400 [Gaiellaceae bacterium]|jgi:hypothetical protein
MDEATVNALAAAADLPLEEGRAALVAPVLGAWLEGANELNRKLQAAERQTVVPITTFGHPPEANDE